MKTNVTETIIEKTETIIEKIFWEIDECKRNIENTKRHIDDSMRHMEKLNGRLAELRQKLESYYSAVLKGCHVKMKNPCPSKGCPETCLGMIENVKFKEDTFWVVINITEITRNNKIIRRNVAIKLLGKEFNEIIFLSPTEYEKEYKNYIIGNLKISNAGDTIIGENHKINDLFTPVWP